MEELDHTASVEAEVKHMSGEARRFKWYLIIASVLIAIWFIIDLSREPSQRVGLPLNLLVTLMAVTWVAKFIHGFWGSRLVTRDGEGQIVKSRSSMPARNGLTRRRKLVLLVSLILMALAGVNEFGHLGWFGPYGMGVVGLTMLLTIFALPRETWGRYI